MLIQDATKTTKRKVYLTSAEKTDYAHTFNLPLELRESLTSWKRRLILSSDWVKSSLDEGLIEFDTELSKIKFVTSWISHPEMVFSNSEALVEFRLPPKDSSEYPRVLIMALKDNLKLLPVTD